MVETNRRTNDPDDVNNDGKISVAESFGALKNRRVQAKNLSDQRRSHDELTQKIQEDSDTLADQRYILEHFDEEVGKQRSIITDAQKQIEKETTQKERLDHNQQEIKAQLDALLKKHKQLEQTYLSEKNQAQDEFDTAKKNASTIESDVKKTGKTIESYNKQIASLQVTRDTAENETTRRKAQENIQATTDSLMEAQERLHQMESERANANARRTTAQASFDAASRAYKDLVKRHESEEGNLQKQLKDLEAKAQKSQSVIAQQSAIVKQAQERIAYCQSVVQNPAQADVLEQNIRTSKTEEEVMRGTISSMEQRHKELKKRSTKAIAVIVLIVVVIIAILLVWFFAFPQPTSS